MDTREIAMEYRLSHWAQIMRECAANGQTIREFCKSSGYREHVYYYWQRKLREAACEELKLPVKQENGREEARVPSGWLVCASEENKPQNESLAIEIGKCRIMAETNVDTELLAKVCRVLVSIC